MSCLPGVVADDYIAKPFDPAELVARVNVNLRQYERVQKKTPKEKNDEQQLATFSTKIYTKDSARQNNLTITCSTLNDTIVKARRNFFFL